MAEKEIRLQIPLEEMDILQQWISDFASDVIPRLL